MLEMSLDHSYGRHSVRDTVDGSERKGCESGEVMGAELGADGCERCWRVGVGEMHRRGVGFYEAGGSCHYSCVLCCHSESEICELCG